MELYIFSAYYYSCAPRIIKVKSRLRAKAYDLARAKAIKIKNDLDLLELDSVLILNI
jgi:hypothetical protein